ncbi:unnamed protein product [Psylliodes chrysocephalus]|uniref:LITAF domain-containing protein n=1 Tax=Psylliodes chrysocephalus TaxID=3402493 RepID=A0A9P0CS15_9CUCU|nr:unnamed protein product [Psylliodes chrysocephala]
MVVIDDDMVYYHFGPKPLPIKCPYCKKMVITDVVDVPNIFTCIYSTLLCLICCPLFWAPYFCTPCMTQYHFCPFCNKLLGVYP